MLAADRWCNGESLSGDPLPLLSWQTCFNEPVPAAAAAAAADKTFKCDHFGGDSPRKVES